MVVAIAGLVGFAIGWTHPALQAALESAQVLAGVVKYPGSNPYYVYHVSLWTLCTQIPALALKLGASELSLTLFISGVMGMLSFQALALITFATSESRWLAVATPIVIFGTRLWDVATLYPIRLLGYPHTYGVVGLGFGLGALGLLGVGSRRSGWFFLGMAPAVHASIGTWCLALGLAALAWEGRTERRAASSWLPFLLGGMLVSAVSFGVHQYFASGLPTVSPDVKTAYLDVFLQDWDIHRKPIEEMTTGLLFGADLLVLTFVWLLAGRAGRDLGLLLRILFLAAGGGLMLAALTKLHPYLPQALQVAMPGRFANLAALAFPPFLLGALARRRSDVAAQGSLVAFAVGLLIASTTINPESVRTAVADFCAHVVVVAWVATQVWGLNDTRPHWASRLRALSSLLLLAAASVSIWRTAAPGTGSRRFETSNLDGAWHGGFFRAVSDEPGLLLTAAGIFDIQLRARRPVLLNGGALDLLPYVPEAGPEMNRILKRVYGINLFRAPADLKHKGSLGTDTGKSLWESRTVEDWQVISSEFGVTGILTPSGWKLDLPIRDRNGDYTYYAIPAASGG
jgi:hypothetical protein